MAKTIFVFNDGTGQSLASDDLSNVAKLFKMLPGEKSSSVFSNEFKYDSDRQYLSFYLAGVGADGADGNYGQTREYRSKLEDKIARKAEQWTDIVTGSAIADRVQRSFHAIKESWYPGDRLILIGFSRGAASIRMLAQLISSEPEMRVDYMLIFDTVFTILTEVEIFGQSQRRFETTRIGAHIVRCDHFISGDEMREAFPLTPVDARSGVRQIVFPGVHSDVGGGNPKHGLSDVSLLAAMQELKELEVSLREDVIEELGISPDPTDEIEWASFGATGQKQFPRDFSKLDFVVHRSNIERANRNGSFSVALAQLVKFETTDKSDLLDLSSLQVKVVK